MLFNPQQYYLNITWKLQVFGKFQQHTKSMLLKIFLCLHFPVLLIFWQRYQLQKLVRLSYYASRYQIRYDEYSELRHLFLWCPISIPSQSNMPTTPAICACCDVKSSHLWLVILTPSLQCYQNWKRLNIWWYNSYSKYGRKVKIYFYLISW